MSLTNEIISEFVKATKDNEKPASESTVYGKVIKHGDKLFVQLQGSDVLTPIKKTTDIKEGEMVSVTIKDHTATVNGNYSSPSARSEDVEKVASKISEFEIVMAHKVTTTELEAVNAAIENLKAVSARIEDAEIVKAYIETLEAKFANVEHLSAAEIDAVKATIESLEADFGNFGNLSAEDLEAVNAEIANLKAYTADFTYVSTEVLEAIKANIQTLEAEKITVEELDAKYATIENLEAQNATIEALEADYGRFETAVVEDLEAQNATIEKLAADYAEIDNLDAKYANIDFANIEMAAVKALFTKSGIIENLTVGDTNITGRLVGVTISGDLIEGNTIKADRLVVLGSDGIYYKLNVDGLGQTTVDDMTPEEQAKLQNGLHGSNIIAKTITAEKISVKDLVAFGATIGGFHITDDALYSGVKEGPLNTTRGIYMDNTGQFSAGDATNYFRYYKAEDDTYKLEISADSFRIRAGTKTIEEELDTIQGDVVNVQTEFSNVKDKVDNLQVGGRNYVLNSDEVTFTHSNSSGTGYTSAFEFSQDFSRDAVGKNITISAYVEGKGLVETSNMHYGVDFNIILTDGTSLWSNFTKGHSIPSPDADGNIPGKIYTRTISIKNVGISEIKTKQAFIRGANYESFTIDDIKVEIGNIATSWTPAPEDLENQLSTFAEEVISGMDDLQSQIDGSITTWFYNYEPNTSNIPASDWNTTELKNQHLGDLFYIVDDENKSGQVYRWALVDGSYQWIFVKDADVTKALADAASAKDVADSKRRTFVSQPTPPYDIGDIWAQGSSGDLMVCQTARSSGSYVSSDWVKSSKYTDDTAINNLVIGGRNLLKNSELVRVWYCQYGDNIIHTVGQNGQTYTVNGRTITNPYQVNFKVGGSGDMRIGANEATDKKFDLSNKTYTISMWVMSDVDCTLHTYVTRQYQDSDGSEKQHALFANTWTRISHSRTFSSRTDIDGVRVRLTASKEVSIVFCLAKVEQGSKATDWTPAPEDVENQLTNFANVVTTVNADIDNLKTQIDGNITTWFYSYEPTTSNEPASKWSTDELKSQHLGDLFYIIDDTTKKGQVYRWALVDGVYKWAKVDNAEVEQALENASKAQSTADAKIRTFITTPTPPYEIGDLWTQGSNGDLMVCKTDRLSGSYVAGDWIKASKYTDDTAVENLQIGGRNLLKNSKVVYMRDNTASAISNKSGHFVDEYDLSSLIGKTLTFSYYQHSPGTRDTSLDTNANMNNRFGMHCTINWTDSTGVNADTVTYPCTNYLVAVSENKRVSQTFTISKPANYDTIKSFNISIQMYAKPASDNNAIWLLGYPKLELGNKATDWTPAPEDVQNDFDNIERTITDAYTTLVNTKTEVILEAVEEQYVRTGEYESFTQRMETELKTTAEGVVVNVNQRISELTEENGKLRADLNEITKYFTFDLNGLTIGEVGSPYKMVLDNDRLSMLANDIEVLHLYNGEVFAPSIALTDKMDIFDYVLTKDSNRNINCEFMDKAPVIVSAPTSKSFGQSDDVTIAITASGDGLTYQWQWRSSNTASYRNSTSGSWLDTTMVSGVTTNTISLTNMSVSCDGYFLRCVITDADGDITYTEDIELIFNGIYNAPILVSYPTEVEFSDGDDISITVEATGDGLTYQWYEYTNAPDAGLSSFILSNGTTDNGTTSISGATTKTITFSTILATYSDYQIMCVVTNSAGVSVRTDAITLVY